MQSNASKSTYFPDLNFVIITGAILGLSSLLLAGIAHFFLDPEATWYVVAIFILEECCFFLAGLLCFRNWRYPSIISDRKIWLILGLGLVAQGIANVIFNYWDLVLGRDANVSLGDIFYVISYVLMVCALFFAVRFRGTSISFSQWLVVGFVGFIAIGLALATNTSSEEETYIFPQNTSQQVIVLDNVIETNYYETPKMDFISDEDTLNQDDNAPKWVIATERTLEPIIDVLNTSYVVADVLMLIMASMLLVTFWGGKFSQTWLATSFAALSFYIADIWYAYVANSTGEAATGFLIDSMWTISAIFFAISAAYEYDLSFKLKQRRS